MVKGWCRAVSEDTMAESKKVAAPGKVAATPKLPMKGGVQADMVDMDESLRQAIGRR